MKNWIPIEKACKYMKIDKPAVLYHARVGNIKKKKNSKDKGYLYSIISIKNYLKYNYKKLRNRTHVTTEEYGYLTPYQVSKVFRIKRSLVYKRIQRGIYKHKKIGKYLLVHVPHYMIPPLPIYDCSRAIKRPKYFMRRRYRTTTRPLCFFKDKFNV
jgi:hypothetical protein